MILKPGQHFTGKFGICYLITKVRPDKVAIKRYRARGGSRWYSRAAILRAMEGGK